MNFWDSELPVKTVSCVEPLGTALLENAVDPPTARSKFEPDVTAENDVPVEMLLAQVNSPL